MKHYSSIATLLLTFGLSASAVEKSLTLEEVKPHNKAKDCWIIVDNGIYDISKFIKDHANLCKDMTLTELCGTDATLVWQKKEKSENSHKKRSLRAFEQNRIGVLAKQ